MNDLPTFTFGRRPRLMLTWGSSFPDKVKLQKRIHIWPLSFKLRFEYDSVSRTTSLGYSCKDAVLGGRIRMDSRVLEYRKRLRVGGGANVGLTAQIEYPGLWTRQPLNATGGLHFQFGSAAAMWAGDVFDLKKKLRISRGLDLQVCGSAQIPVPQAQYIVNANQQHVALGQGPLHFHVAQLNACINL